MFPLLQCGYLEFWFISTKHIYLENVTYIKKQHDQAEVQQINIIKIINSGSPF